MKKYLLIISISFAFYSCKCDKSYNCPSLDADKAAWVHQALNDTIKFRSGTGAEIKFVVNLIDQTQPYSVDCITNEFGTCQCNNECEAVKRFSSVTDMVIGSYKTYNVNVTKSDVNVPYADLNYTIYDHVATIDLYDLNSLQPGDSLLPSVQLGGITYNNVYLNYRDTVHFPNSIISKSYFNKTNGLIAFLNRQSNTFYFR
jgi:hypothetical protein